MHILACYEINAPDDSQKLVGHSFETVEKLNQEALEEIATRLLAHAKAHGLHSEKVIWHSITKLDD